MEDKMLNITCTSNDETLLVEQWISELGCTIERKVWQHKENDYLVMDYKPSWDEEDAFNIIYNVVSQDVNKLEFLNYLIVNHQSKIDQLEKCYQN